MIEQNAIGREHAVSIAVVPHHPICVDLRACIWAPWLEGRNLALRRPRRAEHLGAGRLVELDWKLAPADDLEEPRRAQSGHVARVRGRVEAHPHVALGAEVIHLIWLDVVDDIRYLFRIRQIAVMEYHPRIALVEVPEHVVYPCGVERAGSSDDAVNLIPLGQQEFRKVGAVLTSYASYQSLLHLNAPHGLDSDWISSR